MENYRQSLVSPSTWSCIVILKKLSPRLSGDFYFNPLKDTGAIFSNCLIIWFLEVAVSSCKNVSACRTAIIRLSYCFKTCVSQIKSEIGDVSLSLLVMYTNIASQLCNLCPFRIRRLFGSGVSVMLVNYFSKKPCVMATKLLFQ